MSFNFLNQNIDKCSVQGCCVQEPYVNSINEYIMEEIKTMAYYVKKLDDEGFNTSFFQREVLSFFAEINFNFGFNSKELLKIIQYINQKRTFVQNKYLQLCKTKNKKPIKHTTNLKRTKNLTLSQIAQIGEKLLLQRLSKMNGPSNTLYILCIAILRHIAQNLYELYLYKEFMPQESEKIVSAINALNSVCSEDELSKLIQSLYETSYKIITRKYSIYEERYGAIKEKQLTFSSRQNKCILISGRTLKDLENLLEATSYEDIDIYTHDRMFLAHQYEYFAQNKHLIGQFQKNAQSLKYDFVSFPGPILIGHFQQNKFEGIYRGDLFTTSKISPYGVSYISDNDYSPMIQIAKKRNGFKKAHFKSTLTIGYNWQDVLQKLNAFKKELKANKYKSVLFLGYQRNEMQYNDFLKALASKVSKDTFIISLTQELDLDNVLNLNTYCDYSLDLKILNYLSEIRKAHEFKINAYIMDCSSFLMSNIAISNYFKMNNIFIPPCTKLPNTSSLKYILEKYFNTYITNFVVDEDLEILQKEIS